MAYENIPAARAINSLDINNKNTAHAKPMMIPAIRNNPSRLITPTLMKMVAMLGTVLVSGSGIMTINVKNSIIMPMIGSLREAVRNFMRGLIMKSA